jgi:hypothetical protein
MENLDIDSYDDIVNIYEVITFLIKFTVRVYTVLYYFHNNFSILFKLYWLCQICRIV